MNIILKIAVFSVLFILFIGLIINGQSKQTLGYLFRMFIGLFGLIGLLWAYNVKNK